jgi:demethoxyubiquinone hydroxylase (CLK1/Coq7/Cat5 family)
MELQIRSGVLGMANRYELSDAQWQRIASLLRVNLATEAGAVATIGSL